MAAPPILPRGVQVFERGWLSSNNILLTDAHSSTLVDSGYVTHSAQTLALVERALQGRTLDRLVNTHLHSDHCGGNAALQAHYPALQTLIPPGLAQAVQGWNDADLSYVPTGQNCPPFRLTGLLAPGSTYRWADTEWQVHAAPGHDPHSVILFAPEHRLLISADALWQNGFGVVFPELEGVAAFDEVADSLDLIERLDPAVIIPGHGAVFSGVSDALALARQKLEAFAKAPEKHARYGAKVLLKFKLLEFGRVAKTDFRTWALDVPYMVDLHRQYGAGTDRATWLDMMLAELQRSGALHDDGTVLHDVSH
jgi:glyoxylase-like metal-dependent hydrolase (beta-lactamase superfamily II)